MISTDSLVWRLSRLGTDQELMCIYAAAETRDAVLEQLVHSSCTIYTLARSPALDRKLCVGHRYFAVSCPRVSICTVYDIRRQKLSVVSYANDR